MKGNFKSYVKFLQNQPIKNDFLRSCSILQNKR